MFKPKLRIFNNIYQEQQKMAVIETRVGRSEALYYKDNLTNVKIKYGYTEYLKVLDEVIKMIDAGYTEKTVILKTARIKVLL